MKRTDPPIPCASCGQPMLRWHALQRLCTRCGKDRDVIALRAIVNRAARYGWPVDLTLDDMRRGRAMPCAYCGDPSSGFDRIDNDGGYTRDNVVPACARCNLAKRRWPAESFIAHAAQITLERFKEARATWSARPASDRRVEYDGDPGPED